PMRSRYTKFVLLAPALIVLLLTTTYPLLYALVTSFRDWRLNRGPLPRGWVGFDNYARALTDDGFINSVVVTLIFTVLSVTLSLVLGLAIALLLNKRGWRYTAVKSMLLFPFAISPALKGFSWRFMLNPEYGVYTYLIGTLMPSLKHFVWLSTPADALFWIAVSEVWGWAPLMALMFIGALGAISPEIYEAANLDGAARWSTFSRITLPLLAPVLLIVTLLRAISSLKMFDQVVTLTGGGPGRSTQTLNYYIYQVGFRNLDMGYSSALAVMLVLVLSLFAFAYVRLLLGKRA
ncbi:MAG: sugar ABC transporter permease, partial [Chloroflexota bacterium]|nr:sugar ABC transporter permease [Chloroflexota bacterium]